MSAAQQTQLEQVWDALIPTDYLIVEVLMARVRLGETCWSFPSRHRAAMPRLQSLGFVGSWKDAPVENTLLVWPGGPLLDYIDSKPYTPVSGPRWVGGRQEWGVRDEFGTEAMRDERLARDIARRAPDRWSLVRRTAAGPWQAAS